MEFDYRDALNLECRLTEDERMMRDQVASYCTEKLMPRVLMANRNERKLLSRITNIVCVCYYYYFSFLYIIEYSYAFDRSVVCTQLNYSNSTISVLLSIQVWRLNTQSELSHSPCSWWYLHIQHTKGNVSGSEITTYLITWISQICCKNKTFGSEPYKDCSFFLQC